MSVAGVENRAGSCTGEGGFGAAYDACLRVALFAIAEPPVEIAESCFRGPAAFRLGVLARDLTAELNESFQESL